MFQQLDEAQVIGHHRLAHRLVVGREEGAQAVGHHFGSSAVQLHQPTTQHGFLPHGSGNDVQAIGHPLQAQGQQAVAVEQRGKVQVGVQVAKGGNPLLQPQGHLQVGQPVAAPVFPDLNTPVEIGLTADGKEVVVPLGQPSGQGVQVARPVCAGHRSCFHAQHHAEHRHP